MAGTTSRTGRPVFLTAVGASTCFGGHVAAAAAARAGLTRFQPLPDVLIFDEETKEVEPLVGAPADVVTEGFEGPGRIVRLAADAIDDLRAAYDGEIDWRRTDLFLALAPPPAPSAAADEEELSPREVSLRAEEWAQPIVEQICDLGGLADDPRRRRVFLDERAGTIRALQEAVAFLQDARVDNVLIVAADSAIDDPRLDFWSSQRRLKTPFQPSGLIPGEAAVALLISGSSRRGSRPHGSALLYQPLFEIEPLQPDRPPTGHALGAVLIGAAARTGAPTGTVYADLNGEDTRAIDFGSAVAGLPAESPVRGYRQIFPATTFGETGATSPLLGLVLAARAFARGYAVGNTAVVLAAGDRGERAALTLQRQPSATV